MRTSLVLATLAALAPGCASSEDVTVAEITVLDHLAPCRSFEILDCMLVDEGSGPQYFYNRIAGFAYRWGSTYRLEVEIEAIHDPLPDTSARALRLRQVIAAQPARPRSEFTLALRGELDAQPLRPIGQGFALTFGRQIVCEAPAVCAAITEALGQEAAFDLRLRHPAVPDDEQAPLTAVAVVAR